MSKLTDDVKKTMAQTKIIPVATASKEGMPNVIPFAFVKWLDEDTVLLADNFMNKSLKNLKENPYISICVWDAENKRSFQIKGEAVIETSGKVYDETVAWVKKQCLNYHRNQLFS
jgi:predicted pyridoxine 5'-phosphate oxidase superfamily flavin-nucleotide-binding protein